MTFTAREGDFVETGEGLIFDVKGFYHPPDRVICYVRYVPDPLGERKRGDIRYRKIYDLKEREAYLKENYPDYVFFDPVFNRRLQGVPIEDIKKVYYPPEKLRELCDAPHKDSLEESTVELTRLLDIPVDTVGVSGSILVELHTPDSDIDIIVYGEEYSVTGYKQLKKLREKKVITPLDPQKAREKAQSRWGSTTAAIIQLEQQKIMHGIFQGKEYFFRFLKDDHIHYGDVTYRPLGKVVLQAVVKDDRENIFTPCRYSIEDSSLEGVEHLISVRGRFCEQVKKGDHIACRGTLEKVVKGECWYYQVMLGEYGDYLFARE